MEIQHAKLADIVVNKSNPRYISDGNFNKLISSLLVFPTMLELRPIVIDNKNIVLGGNMRLQALNKIAALGAEEITALLEDARDYQKMPAKSKKAVVTYWLSWLSNPDVPIVRAETLSKEEKRQFIIKDNTSFGDWDWDLLANEWDRAELDDWGLAMDDWCVAEEQEGQQDTTTTATNENILTLADTFIIPPLSIIDTRRGIWQARKRMWRAFIGDMGETREDMGIHSLSMKYARLYSKTQKYRESLGINFKEYIEKYVPQEVLEHEGKKTFATGVSLFDPVLAEISCRWFMPKHGTTIFDPFAGDTQKGLVFGKCGYEFTGIELRQEQVDTNNTVLQRFNFPITYICDDGRNVAKHIKANSQDMLFSCPPYFDLEVYSDNPNDASNQKSYTDFLAILRTAFNEAITCLKNDRFAVIVVGDIRNKKTGAYYDFVGDVKRIFMEGGVQLYNELILIEMIGTAAVRARGYMKSRKVVKVHQNVLVFYKGNTANIKENFADINYSNEEWDMLMADFESKDAIAIENDGDNESA